MNESEMPRGSTERNVQDDTIAQMTLQMHKSGDLDGFLRAALNNPNTTPALLLEEYARGNTKAEEAIRESLARISTDGTHDDVTPSQQKQVVHEEETKPPAFSKDARAAFDTMQKFAQRDYIRSLIEEGNDKETIATIYGFSKEEEDMFFPSRVERETPPQEGAVSVDDEPEVLAEAEPVTSEDSKDAEIIPEPPPVEKTVVTVERPVAFRAVPNSGEPWHKSKLARALILYGTKGGMDPYLIGKMLYYFGFRRTDDTTRRELTPDDFAKSAQVLQVPFDDLGKLALFPTEGGRVEIKEDIHVQARELVREYITWLIAYQREADEKGIPSYIPVQNLSPEKVK